MDIKVLYGKEELLKDVQEFFKEEEIQSQLMTEGIEYLSDEAFEKFSLWVLAHKVIPPYGYEVLDTGRGSFAHRSKLGTTDGYASFEQAAIKAWEEKGRRRGYNQGIERTLWHLSHKVSNFFSNIQEELTFRNV